MSALALAAFLFLSHNGRAVFPIGSYELPKDDAGLRAMAEAGINLVRCRNRADLDRAAAAGIQGWMVLPLHLGIEDGKLGRLIESVKDHPALAVWEGPDEIVWNFTAYSGLHRSGVYPSPDEWWRQSPLAVAHAEREAARIMPKLRAGIQLVRQKDPRRRPVWINEASRSDLKYIRQYSDLIDITGCDLYPIHAATRLPVSIADLTDRYRRVGPGLAVWMVLQGFAWGQLAGREERVTYPALEESRLMAWAAITHGARGVLYWGMDAAPPSEVFRESLYAVTAELSALQPFLVAPEARGVKVDVIDSEDFDKPRRGVSWICRRTGPDWMVVLVNEDDRPHMGVAVSGLPEGARLEQLYGGEWVSVVRGEFVTRMKPHEVKVFATGRRWEKIRPAGRVFVMP